MTPASGGAALAGMAALARWADTAGGATPSTQPAAGSGQGPEWGEAAPIGLLIILLMGGALFLLMKSMSRNLRRVPDSFDGPASEVDPAAAASRRRTVAGGPTDGTDGARSTDSNDPADSADPHDRHDPTDSDDPTGSAEPAAEASADSSTTFEDDATMHGAPDDDRRSPAS